MAPTYFSSLRSSYSPSPTLCFKKATWILQKANKTATIPDRAQGQMRERRMLDPLCGGSCARAGEEQDELTAPLLSCPQGPGHGTAFHSQSVPLYVWSQKRAGKIGKFTYCPALREFKYKNINNSEIWQKPFRCMVSVLEVNCPVAWERMTK